MISNDDIIKVDCLSKILLLMKGNHTVMNFENEYRTEFCGKVTEKFVGRKIRVWNCI